MGPNPVWLVSLWKREIGSVWEDEKVLAMDGAGGCTTVWISLMALNGVAKMVNFMYILPVKKIQVRWELGHEDRYMQRKDDRKRREKTAMHQPRTEAWHWPSQPLEGTSSADTLISDFQPPELGEKQPLVFVCLAAPVAYGGAQAGGWFGAAAVSLHHSHSNAGSEPCLWPTPQLMATPDP